MIPRAYWLLDSGPQGISEVWTSKRTAPGVWTPKTLAYSAITNPPVVPPGFNPATMGVEGLSASVMPGPGDDPGILLELDDVSQYDLNAYSLIDNSTPPVTVEFNHAQFMRGYFSNSQGCWYLNGAWWTIQAVDVVANPTKLRVYKSLDRITWTAQDTANEPLPYYGTTSSWWDGDYPAGGKIKVIYAEDFRNPTWYLRELDTATGTWGAPHDPVNLASGLLVPYVRCLLTGTSGDVYILYQYNNAGVGGTYYGILSGGVWTTGVSIDPLTPVGQSQIQTLLDPDGSTIHYLFNANNVFPPYLAYYRQIQSGGAVVVAANHTFDHTVESFWWNGHAILLGGEILLPTSVGANRSPCVLVGTPLANPVWTTEVIDPDEMFDSQAIFLGLVEEPISISCDSPPDGLVGAAYSHAFPASGGTPPYTFSIVAGSLPPGLSLDPLTGIVSGVATTPGVYSFIIQVVGS